MCWITLAACLLYLEGKHVTGAPWNQEQWLNSFIMLRSCEPLEQQGQWCHWGPWDPCDPITCTRKRIRKCDCPPATDWKKGACETKLPQNDYYYDKVSVIFETLTWQVVQIYQMQHFNTRFTCRWDVLYWFLDKESCFSQCTCKVQYFQTVYIIIAYENTGLFLETDSNINREKLNSRVTKSRYGELKSDLTVSVLRLINSSFTQLDTFSCLLTSCHRRRRTQI